jgi:hypothetical protein
LKRLKGRPSLPEAEAQQLFNNAGMATNVAKVRENSRAFLSCYALRAGIVAGAPSLIFRLAPDGRSPHLAVMRKLTLDTPTGPVTLTEQDGAITGCQWDRSAAPVSQTRTSPLSEAAAVQLVSLRRGPSGGLISRGFNECPYGRTRRPPPH